VSEGHLRTLNGESSWDLLVLKHECPYTEWRVCDVQRLSAFRCHRSAGPSKRLRRKIAAMIVREGLSSAIAEDRFGAIWARMEGYDGGFPTQLLVNVQSPISWTRLADFCDNQPAEVVINSGVTSVQYRLGTVERGGESRRLSSTGPMIGDIDAQEVTQRIRKSGAGQVALSGESFALWASHGESLRRCDSGISLPR